MKRIFSLVVVLTPLIFLIFTNCLAQDSEASTDKEAEKTPAERLQEAKGFSALKIRYPALDPAKASIVGKKGEEDKGIVISPLGTHLPDLTQANENWTPYLGAEMNDNAYLVRIRNLQGEYPEEEIYILQLQLVFFEEGGGMKGSIPQNFVVVVPEGLTIEEVMRKRFLDSTDIISAIKSATF